MILSHSMPTTNLRSARSAVYNGRRNRPTADLLVTQLAPHTLFPEMEVKPGPKATLFAEVAFDLPLDHSYTYGVPDRLRERVALGKRVLAPFGKGHRTEIGFCVKLSKTGPERDVKDLSQVIDDESLLTPSLMELTRWMADYYLCGWGQVLNAVVPTGAKHQSGTRMVAFVEPLPEADWPDPFPKLTAKQQAAWELLRQHEPGIEVKRLTELAQCGPGPVEALIRSRLARRVERRVERFQSDGETSSASETPITLNPDQLNAWAPIEQGVRKGGFQVFLLHGVTGSGKTEIYLRAMEETIRQGKEVLVLVPEISLTPQTIQRFEGRCKDVAVLHSNLGQAERGWQWRRVAAGQVQAVVGARSAIFAPARQLGLIIVDEEHEGSFKQDTTPRYHGRDVAVKRAQMENVPIILGSATPSLESWHNTQRGQYTLLTLPNRVLDLPLPRVALIDLRQETPRRGKPQALSPSLERAMRAALRDGGQIMLLLNRRGFSTHIHCPSCGFVQSCKNCDLAMTYHRERSMMLCHYCGSEQPPPLRCPQCRELSVRYQGLGTEKLQVEITEKFPDAVVRRMDSDTMKKPGSHAQLLAEFRAGLVHILLGTQMIAKGLDFPNVTLVGVINADTGLNIPDFRSSERTFQLLSQVAGRAGRGPRGGQVVVQTFNPEQPAVALAAKHDYLTFVQQELAQRHEHNYPPYQRMARLIVRGKRQDVAERFAATLAEALANAHGLQPVGLTDQLRILGPAECPVFRLKGMYRYHFQVQSSSHTMLHRVLHRVLDAVHVPSGVEFTVDVDPYDMV